MTDEVIRYLKKAGHALEVAEDLLESGHIPDAASKIYYAMYYAAQALLKANGIDVIKHSAVESAFGYYFAKPGRIDSNPHAPPACQFGIACGKGGEKGEAGGFGGFF